MRQITVLLLAIFSCLYLSEATTPNVRSLYSYVTKQGSVPLTKDSYGYYVNVDLAYNYNDASDSNAYDEDLVEMSVSLYNDQTMLVQSCLEYSVMNCEDYYCYNYTYWNTSANYLSFSAQGYYFSADVYLDYSYWELSGYAMKATSCSSYGISSAGYGRYGVIGLGANTSSNNFIQTPIFSINLDRYNGYGHLLFSSNSTATSDGSYVAALQANSNWQIAPTTITMTVSYTSLSFTAGILFDLDTDAIGFPLTQFSDIIGYLTTYSQASCYSYTYYKPTCNYNGLLSDLPTISLQVQGQTIDIPPSLYVYDYYDDDDQIYGSFTLNLKALSSSLSGNNYVNPAYANYIVFDQNFMSYYYTEFSSSYPNYTITLYNLYTGSVVWPYIVGGCVGLVILIIIIACCIKQRNRRLAGVKIVQVINNPGDQVPFVANDQQFFAQTNQGQFAYNAYDPNPYKDAGGFNQPGGNQYYNQQQQYPGQFANYQ